ncbi:hypothetical protein LSAT2_022481 [Lamellibrachia satsuma]|nr:hypothetical protein LSAT2_022481 [Lamellibrachia satsuma]
MPQSCTDKISYNERSFFSDNLQITTRSGPHTKQLQMAPSVQQQQFDSGLSIPVLPEDGGANRMFVAGFRDCADEVLRYLIEVENMAEDDPIIVGLREHLAEQEDEARWRCCRVCGDAEREQCLVGRCMAHAPVPKDSLAATSTYVPSDFRYDLIDSCVLPRDRCVVDATDYGYYSESPDCADTAIAEVVESVLLSNNLPATPELLQELIDGLCDDLTDSDTSGVESMDED